MIGLLNLLLSAATVWWAPPPPTTAPSSEAARVAPPPGPVFAVGGGDTPAAVFARMLDATGKGKRAAIVVFPQASKRADGSIDRKHWRAAGAETITALVDLRKRRKFVVDALKTADVLWFGGGSQTRLMAALSDAKLVEHIRQAHARGAVVGGTSAGAAVLSDLMISGATKRALRGGMPTFRGLGLWPNVAIDQHFVARKRFGRLLTAILDNHARVRVGVGVGEDTAAVYWPAAGEIEVIGGGSVVICDARKASRSAAKARGLMAATGVQLHVLRAPQRWPLVP